MATLIILAAGYVIASFIAPNPGLRIALRCVPVIPVAIWTLWFDRSRPFSRRPLLLRTAGRLLLLVAVMAFAVAVLGVALNWLYDPARVM